MIGGDVADIAVVEAGVDVMVGVAISDVDAATSGNSRATATDDAHGREQPLAMMCRFIYTLCCVCLLGGADQLVRSAAGSDYSCSGRESRPAVGRGLVVR